MAGIEGLSVQSPAEAARTERSVYYELAKKLVAEHPEADGVLLGARGNLQEAAVPLEQDLGMPVVHGLQACLWWALRQLRVSQPRTDLGRLLGS